MYLYGHMNALVLCIQQHVKLLESQILSVFDIEI